MSLLQKISSVRNTGCKCSATKRERWWCCEKKIIYEEKKEMLEEQEEAEKRLKKRIANIKKYCKYIQISELGVKRCETCEGCIKKKDDEIKMMEKRDEEI